MNKTPEAKVTALFSAANRYGTLIERKVVPESTH